MSFMCTSQMIKSGSSRRATSSPVCPSSAWRGLNPRRSRAIMVAPRNTSSSSMTRIFCMGTRSGFNRSLQSSGDGGQQLFRSEGFREKSHVPELLAHRFIFLQAARRDDAHVGIEDLERADRGRTVQKRHHEVGQDEINFVLVLRE